VRLELHGDRLDRRWTPHGAPAKGGSIEGTAKPKVSYLVSLVSEKEHQECLKAAKSENEMKG
jgi:hypothetical protein